MLIQTHALKPKRQRLGARGAMVIAPGPNRAGLQPADEIDQLVRHVIEELCAFLRACQRGGADRSRLRHLRGPADDTGRSAAEGEHYFIRRCGDLPHRNYLRAEGEGQPQSAEARQRSRLGCVAVGPAYGDGSGRARECFHRYTVMTRIEEMSVRLGI